MQNFNTSSSTSSLSDIYYYKLHKNSLILNESYPVWRKGLNNVLFTSLDLKNLKNIPTIISVGGGKGGVGKSIITANLAQHIAKYGFKVLALDLDIGGANLHTYFNIFQPRRSLADFLLVTTPKEFHECILDTSFNGVGLLAGNQDIRWGQYIISNPNLLNKLWLSVLKSKDDLGIDFVLVDLGAGTLPYTINAAITSHLSIVTVLAEPAAIENAYAFIKNYIWQIIENLSYNLNLTLELVRFKDAFTNFQNTQSNLTYFDIFRKLYPHFNFLIDEIFKVLRARFNGIIVNQCRFHEDIEISKTMELICKKYFGINAYDLGDLNYEESLWKATRNKKLLSSEYQYCFFVKKMKAITLKILNLLGYVVK